MKKPLDKVMPENKIVLKALLIVSRNGKSLASKGYDPIKSEHFYRLLGGTMEFGETSEQTIRREMLEELNTDLANLKFLEVTQNIFQYKGRAGHQIIFLYQADFLNEDLYQLDQIQIVEQEYDGPVAEWISVDDIISEKIRLYPTFDFKRYLNHSV